MNLNKWIEHARTLNKFELRQNIKAISNLDKTTFNEFTGLDDVRRIFEIILNEVEEKEYKLNKKSEKKDFENHLGQFRETKNDLIENGEFVGMDTRYLEIDGLYDSE